MCLRMQLKRKVKLITEKSFVLKVKSLKFFAQIQIQAQMQVQMQMQQQQQMMMQMWMLQMMQMMQTQMMQMQTQMVRIRNLGAKWQSLPHSSRLEGDRAVATEAYLQMKQNISWLQKLQQGFHLDLYDDLVH